jgi:hypothetical protein
MMEKDDFLKDDLLRELIRRSPLDSPSDDFVDRVMANIQLTPEIAVVKKPYYQFLKTATPYAVIAITLFFVIATSDMPIFNWIPGKDFLINSMWPYLGTLLATFKVAFASKYVSWIMLISFSAGVLFLVDRLFSRRPSI